MKLLTIVGIAALTIASSNAATISVSGGFGVGVLVTTNLVNTAYSLEVGGYESNIFTLFAAPAVPKLEGQKIAGSFGGTGPISLNGDPIFLRVATTDGFAILSTANVFPADVSSGLLTQTVNFTSSASGSVVAFGGSPELTNVSFSSANGLNFTVVPEPSAALLGALGALGLLRRRRI